MKQVTKKWLDNYVKEHSWKGLVVLQTKYLKQGNLKAVKVISEYAKPTKTTTLKLPLDNS